MYRKNTSGQFIGFAGINASTGADMTGTTGFAAYRVIDGGAQAAATGNITDKGNGQYSFALSQADTNGDNISIKFSMTGMVSVEKTFVTTAANPTDAVRFGLTALPNAAANANGGLPILSVSGTTLGYTISTLTTYTGNTPQTGDSFVRIGAAGAGLTGLGDTRLANLDAAVSSRMATYTQPTGFLAATFPATVATTAPTAAAIRSEMDGNSTQLAKIGSPATGTIGGAIAALQTTADTISTATSGDPTDTLDSGTAQAGAAGKITLRSGSTYSLSATGNDYVFIIFGTGRGQKRRVTAMNTGTKEASVTPNWTITPDSTSHYAVYNDGEYVFTDSTGRVVLQPTQAGVTIPTVSTVTTVGSVTNPVSLNLAQALSAARAVDAIADTSLTLNDALHAAIAGATGKETKSGTIYVVKTPSTGTVLRTFTLDDADNPTSRT